EDVSGVGIGAVMGEGAREGFVASDQADLAYADMDIPVRGEPGARAARCLIRPRTLAKLIQVADIQGQDLVLDVGGTTGYGAAVMARLARHGVALEGERAQDSDH